MHSDFYHYYVIDMIVLLWFLSLVALSKRSNDEFKQKLNKISLFFLPLLFHLSILFLLLFHTFLFSLIHKGLSFSTIHACYNLIFSIELFDSKIVVFIRKLVPVLCYIQFDDIFISLTSAFLTITKKNNRRKNLFIRLLCVHMLLLEEFSNLIIIFMRDFIILCLPIGLAKLISNILISYTTFIRSLLNCLFQMLF